MFARHVESVRVVRSLEEGIVGPQEGVVKEVVDAVGDGEGVELRDPCDEEAGAGGEKEADGAEENPEDEGTEVRVVEAGVCSGGEG